MRGSRHKSKDIPWLMVATVAGIAAVVIIAVVYSSGGGIPVGENAHDASPVQTGVVGTSTSTPHVSATSTPSGTSTVPVIVRETTPVTVPGEGVIVKVDYVGSFSGSYGSGGQVQTVKNSGTQVYSLDTAAGTVTASFRKEDGTTKHALTVEIYKNGNLLKSGSTMSAYGTVDISAAV
ncbi:MAG: hypothetical protein WC391_09375 [Methanoregula sp.]